jgi:hypothetical protein
MNSTFKPSDAAVLAHRRSMGRRVRAVATLLRLVGRTREAKKLQVGYETFCVVNNSKTDKDLTFSTRALLALEAALAPGDASDYLLVWRPVTGLTAGSTSSSSSSSNEAKQQLQGSEAVAAAGAAASAAARSAVHLAPVAGDLVWRRYLHTQMAGVYRMLFGAVPEANTAAAAVAKAAGEAAGKKTKSCKKCCSKCCKKCCSKHSKTSVGGNSVQHDFVFIK